MRGHSPGSQLEFVLQTLTDFVGQSQGLIHIATVFPGLGIARLSRCASVGMTVIAAGRAAVLAGTEHHAEVEIVLERCGDRRLRIAVADAQHGVVAVFN